MFEDNAEHGLGMFLGQKAVRDRLIACVERIAGRTECAELKDLCTAYLDTVDDGQANAEASEKLIAKLESINCDCFSRYFFIAYCAVNYHII